MIVLINRKKLKKKDRLKLLDPNPIFKNNKICVIMSIIIMIIIVICTHLKIRIFQKKYKMFNIDLINTANNTSINMTQMKNNHLLAKQSQRCPNAHQPTKNSTNPKQKHKPNQKMLTPTSTTSIMKYKIILINPHPLQCNPLTYNMKIIS
jgi:hypothetical protein